MAMCTCHSKSILHLSTCDVIQNRGKDNTIYYYLSQLKEGTYFFICDRTSTDDVVDELKIHLQHLWMAIIRTDNITTIITLDGAEIVFIPKTEIKTLEGFESKEIFIDSDNKSLEQDVLPWTKKVSYITSDRVFC